MRDSPYGTRLEARTRLRFGALALGAALCALPAAAHAQKATGEAAAAEELFQSARKLMADGRHGEACPKLEASLRLDPAPGTRLNLADCYEHIGRTATAWLIYTELAAAAHTTGQLDKEQLASEHAAALEPRLSKLLVEVPPEAGAIPGLVVERDGKVMEPGLFDVAIPVDPGDRRIDARAPGREAWSRTVVIATPGTTVRVRVELAGGPPKED